MDRLNRRFGDHLLRKQYEILLPTRKRQANESLADLASDIRLMCDIVYKDLESAIKEKMAIKHFNMAIEAPAAQYELAKSQANTLDELVAAAQVRELYFGHESAWTMKSKSTHFNKVPENSRFNNQNRSNQISDQPIFNSQNRPV